VAAVVAADEDPVLAADRLAPEVELARVVVERQSTVAEEARQALSLIPCVADAVVDRRVLVELGPEGVAPREEPLDDRLGVLGPQALAFLTRRRQERAFDLEERADETKRDLRAVGIRVECLEEVPAAMRLMPSSA
jgi:hypothetical protein